MGLELKLSGAQVHALLTPPEGVDAGIYVAHINAIVFAEDKKDLRGPGRPLVYKHPAYSEDEWKAIKALVYRELNSSDPDIWINGSGPRPKGVALLQPDDEKDIVLDNGVIMSYSERIKFDQKNGEVIAFSIFPPSAR